MVHFQYVYTITDKNVLKNKNGDTHDKNGRIPSNFRATAYPRKHLLFQSQQQKDQKKV